ncbi:hypothetical protein [Peribacillus sp. NPDC060253]|uniref:hypothetical protein n=1 Tax=Peribacillus sp. NPDC060253 TaxID=3347084 RepID=UPI00365F32A1
MEKRCKWFKTIYSPYRAKYPYALVTTNTADINTEMVIEGSTTPSPYVLYNEGYSFTKPSVSWAKVNVLGDIIAGLNATKPYTTVISEGAGVTTIQS